jgi:hypothetical protein
VVSVDGRDVVDGKPGDFRSKGGYVVQPYGFVDIDGWRVSQREAAAFRFTSVSRSYAGRMGNPRNVGVIGVAVFPERTYVPRPRPIYPLGQGYPASPSADAPARSEGKAAAPSARAMEEEAGRGQATRRPGLGTEFGEAVDSRVRAVAFTRANPNTPAVILGVRYNDRPGLLALGIDVDGIYDDGREAWLRGTANPFPVSQRSYATPPPGWRR